MLPWCGRCVVDRLVIYYEYTYSQSVPGTIPKCSLTHQTCTIQWLFHTNLSMGGVESAPELDVASSRQLLNSLHRSNTDTSQPAFHRHVHRRYPPSSLRQIRRIVNPICVLRDSLELVKEDGLYYLEMEVISKFEGVVRVTQLQPPHTEQDVIYINTGPAQRYRVSRGLSEEELELCVSTHSPTFLIEANPRNSSEIKQLSAVTVEKAENGVKVKTISQRVKVRDTEYVTYEIFGAGKRRAEDCVVCLSQPRDTAVMPCRHLCLCLSCAEVFRRQTTCKCPICRASENYADIESLLEVPTEASE